MGGQWEIEVNKQGADDIQSEGKYEDKMKN